MYSASTIDAQAEREALAISTLAALTDSDVPTDRRIHLARLIDRARQLGYVAPAHPRYPRKRVVKRWIQICESIDANQPVPKRPIEIVTAEDRQRRMAKRLMRREVLRQLSALRGTVAVDTTRAAELSGIPASTLQKAMKRGVLSARLTHPRVNHNCPGRGAYLTTVAALRQYLASRYIAA